MTSSPIEMYGPEWNSTEHSGRIALKVDGAWHYVHLETPAEYSVIIDLLRNEGPVNLVKERTIWRIRTAGEEIGEGDV